MYIARRRALRSTVLAASLAVLASFAVAPAASAEEASATPTSGAAETTAAPTEEPTATDAPATTEAPAPTEAPTETPAPTSAPSTDAAPTTEAPTPTESADVEPGDTVVGELVQAWPDPTAEEAHTEDQHADEAPLSWIQPAEGDAVRVPTDDLPSAPVGSTVAVTVGDELSDEASAEEGYDEAREVLDAQVLQAAAPDPSTAAAGAAPTNTVTVVLVVPAGASANSTTVSQVVNQVNGDVASFWSSQSDNTVRITAVAGAAGWVTSSKGCSDPTGLWNDVAARVGWTSGPGKHLMLYVPGTAADCSYGLGTVGSSIGSGGLSYVRDVATSVMAHELGHNFGLGHSAEVQCDGAVEVGSCQTRAYYDLYDVMGISWGQVGSLNVVQASRLGLVPTSERVALTPSSPTTSVTLVPVSATSGTRAVQLTDSNGIVYWLEFRQASGRDAWLGDSRNAYGLEGGVILRRAAGQPNTSLLLDGTPSRENGWSSDLRSALPLGTAVSVMSGNFSVKVTSVSAGGATVVVGDGTVPVAPPSQTLGQSLPRGNWESLSASGSTISVAGWAVDLDQASTSSTVHVYVDGGGRAITADGSRPDVGAVFPGAGAAHGFSASLQVGPGVHTVCVYAIDNDFTSRNTPFGCRTVQTQMALPIANWEGVQASGAAITVSGWALDPDQPTTPSPVHVYVDGNGRAVAADGTRTDVAAAFPGVGSAHGFSATVQVTPGAHSVCVYAVDADLPARNAPLGCRTVFTQVTPPTGNWEAVSTAGDTIRLTGWSLDPDNLSAPTQVHVYVDGAGTALVASRSRADVAATFPGAGGAHGFDVSRQVRPGAHSVCVYAMDLDTTWRNTALGCREVVTQMAAPTGNWEVLGTSGTAVTVGGWTMDPDAPGVSGQVHVYVDGSGVAVTADRSRPDVGNAFPGAGSAHGFSWTANLAAGPHSVCVYAIDLDTSWRNTSLGCRRVTI